MTRVRILVLPGLGQNAALLCSKYRLIRSAIAGAAEMVFVDPTHVRELPTKSSADLQNSATFETPTPETAPRTWYFAEGQEGRHLTRFDESLQRLREIFETQGPFDAVWGFSMGAAMTVIVAALLERPLLSPIFAKPGPNWPPKPLKFVVMIAGFLLKDPTVQCFYGEKISTPSLHILGKADTFIGQEHSLPLVALFQNPRLEWHDGGHHTPSRPSWRKFYDEYLNAFATGHADSEAHQVAGPNGCDTTSSESGWEVIATPRALKTVRKIEMCCLHHCSRWLKELD